MDCSPPGFSVHGISQSRVLEWIAISFPRGSSRPRDRTPISCTASGFFTNLATRKTQSLCPCPGWGEKVHFCHGPEESLILFFFLQVEITGGKLGALLLYFSQIDKKHTMLG